MIILKGTNFVRFLVVLLSVSLLFTSCAPTHIHREGLEEYCKSKGGYSENHIASERFLDWKFVEQYSYIDGDLIYDYFGSLLTEELDRSLAWISYKDDIYQNAKQDCFIEGLQAINNGVELLGFTFYLKPDWHFPSEFTAFGYNDEENTLVFVGFCCTRDDESEYVSLAETDFGAFLEHFYGEWYDWK